MLQLTWIPRPSTWNTFFFQGISSFSSATRKCQSACKCIPITHFYHKKPYLIALLYSSILKCLSAFDAPPSHQFSSELMLILFLSLPLHWTVIHSIPIIHTLLEPEIHCLPQKYFCICSNIFLLLYCITGPHLFLGISYPVLAKFPSLQKAHTFLLLTLFLLWFIGLSISFLEEIGRIVTLKDENKQGGCEFIKLICFKCYRDLLFD